MFGSNTGTGFQAQNKPASFSFGSSNNTAGASSTPGFGTTANSGFSLGNSNANSGAFGAKPAGTGGSTGGLFGGSTAAGNNANSGTGLFGANSANSANPANPATSGGGLFGGNAGSNTGTSGGLFGNASANAPANTGTSGGLFGNNSANSANATTTPASGGLFGNNSSNTATNSGASGGLFGSANASGSTGTSLFGSTPAPQGGAASTGGGLFGSTNTGSQTSTGGGLFGKPAAPAPAAGTGGLFGSNTATGNGLFGASAGPAGAQPQPQPQQNTANNAQPSFSWSTGPAQGAASNGAANSLSNLEIRIPAQQKMTPNATSYTPAVNDQLARLKEQWDPNSAKCALKTHIYNKFSEQEIAVLLQQPRPASETPEDWERAMAQRPSPLHYPVKVSSFSEMARRVEVQLDHVARSRVLLNTIYEKQTQLSAQRDLDTSTRILKAKARHTKLSRRLLHLATLLAVLKLKGYPLLPEEEEVSKQFQILNAKLSDPSGAVGQLGELHARLAVLKGRSEDLSAQLESSISTMNGGLDTLAHGASSSTDLAAHTEQAIHQLTQLLYKQQMGLGYLNDVVQGDLAVVAAYQKK